MTRRRPVDAPRARMSDAMATAVTRELVRLCLGGHPDRLELTFTTSKEPPA